MTDKTPDKSAKKNRHIKQQSESQKPFSRLNFIVMGISAALIVLGFLLMAGGNSDDPNVFSYEIFSTRRIVIGPLLAFIGFLGIGAGIIIRPRTKQN